MSHPLFSTRRAVVGLLLVAWTLGSSGFHALAAQRPETISLEPSEMALAHHAGEEGGAVGALGSAITSPILATTVTAHVDKQGFSDSLWGNMLLSMAFQRDEELRKLIKGLGRVNTLTMLSVVGVSGLGLAQSIYSYNQLHPETVEVTEAHGPNGHDHVHMPLESKVPATMGIISSGVTLATLGVRGVMGKAYGRKINARQAALRDQVDRILSRLTENNADTEARQELTRLVGERAGTEFLQLWRVLHTAM